MIYPGSPRSWNVERPSSGSFDVETTFVRANLARKRGKKSSRGSDSPLYSAIWPAFNIIRIFGLGPYDFANERLAPSNLYLIPTFVSLSLYSYVMYTVFLRFTGLKRERPVLGATETGKVLFNFFVAIHDTILAMFTRSTFVKVWNCLQDFDETVRQLGYPRKERRTTIVVWCLLAINTVIWISINQTGMYAFLEKWVYNMGYAWIYIGTSVSVYKYAGMCLLLGQRFQHLNEIAKQNMEPILGPKGSSVVSKKTVQGLHNDLMVACETLDSLYSNSVLFWLANLSVHSVSNMYFVISYIFDWASVAPLVFCLCSWLTNFISQIFVIHIACDYASSEANNMASILNEWQFHQLQRNPNDPSFESSVHLFNRQLHFWAGGCFHVNLPLLRSIGGLLSTYLVILLQLPE